LTRTGGAAWLLLAPAIVLLAILLVVPVAGTAYLSLQPNVIVQFDAPGLGNFAYLLSKDYYLDAVWRTLRVSGWVTLVSLVAGYAAALALRAVVRGAAATPIIALSYPVLTGPLIVVLGWMIMLTDGGPVLRPLIQAGLIGPQRLIGTETAVVIALTQFVLPFAVLTLYAVLRTIPDDLVDAARSLGASRLQVLIRVLLPLSVPGIVSAVVISFALAASAYVSPYYIGGATKLVLTTMVGQFILGSFNTELAATAAMLLLGLMAVTMFAVTAIGARLSR
jgi:putative spermidine/putrescine transport system permease protein